jgi:large subunit ribosomal protein L24
MKLKLEDNVIVIAGKDKDSKGRIKSINHKTQRVVVTDVNMITKHMKPNRTNQRGGIVNKEAPIHVSNVMYLHNGKPTRIGYKVTVTEQDGKKRVVKQRIAKSTGEVID